MLNEFLKNAIHEMRSARTKRNHPFKYVTLTTIDERQAPQSRTVVLRAMEEDYKCIIFTDSRTQKVSQLLNNPNACILAYHPKKLLQVKLNGTLSRITDTTETKKWFQKVSAKAIKDYTTVNAPGTEIDNPDHVDYKEPKENSFVALEFLPYEIECLQLKRPNHLRAVFKKANDWQGQWLVP